MKKDWIDFFMEYTEFQESPRLFHKWSAISIIAASMARRSWIDMGYFLIYPNMYIILTAESAWCKKSTAANIAVNTFLTPAATTPILTHEFTRQYLMEVMSKNKGDAAIMLYASELATLLGQTAFSNGLISFLTDIYDCPEKLDYGTRNKGVFVVRNSCPNFLAATTLDWMSNNIPGDAIEGGFTGRVIFVVCEDPSKRISMHTMTEAQIQIRDVLRKDLKRIGLLGGQFRFSQDGFKYYDNLYTKIKPIGDQRLRAYYGRKGTHILKLAMVFCAASSDTYLPEHLILTPEHISKAESLLKETETLMASAFRGSSFDKSAKHVDRIIRQLEKFNKPMPHFLLLKKNYLHLDAIKFKGVIDTLIESRIVRVVEGRGRLYELYKKRGGD